MRRLMLVIVAILSVVCTVMLGVMTEIAADHLPEWLRPYQNSPWIVIGSLSVVSIVLVLASRGFEQPSNGRSKSAKPGQRPRRRGNYRKRYYEHIIHKYRDFDVKGLSTQGIYNLEQENVYVRLSVEPQPAEQISTGLITVMPETLRRGEHSIWDYLQAPKMGDHHFAVIGAPGSGKTTLLKHVVLTLADARKRRRARVPGRTPMLLLLRDHIEQIKKNPDVRLTDLMRRNLAVWDLAPPDGWFENELQKRRCVVMFDGLDEVADLQFRKQVVKWVERQMTRYADNWFIVTSRPGGYRSNPLAGVHVLGVRPFTGDQVKEFVINWYRAIEVMSSAGKDDLGVQMKAQEGAKDLLRRLANAPALTELAANPLLLTMIATIHRYRSTLPGKRVELYSEICEVSLGKRRQAFDLDLDLAPLQKQRVLEPLAYQMMKNQQQVIKVEDALKWIEEPLALINPQMAGIDFLKKIEETSGLLLERESSIYSFAHKTFQEYLTAIHIERNRLEHELTARVEDLWWHETIRLYAARTDASAIIEACIPNENPSVRALALARECLKEAAAIRPSLRSFMENFFRHDTEDGNEQRRKNAAEAMLASRVTRMARLDEQRLIDTTLVTNAEYQLFLDELQAQGKYCQPDYWLGLHFPNGQGNTPVVGVRHDDALAFCDWLTERDGEWRYSLPSVSERDTYYHETTPNTGYWSRDEQQVGGPGEPDATRMRLDGPIDLEATRANLLRRLDRDLATLQILLLIHIFQDILSHARTLLSNATHDRNLPQAREQAAGVVRDLEIAENLARNCVTARDYNIHELFHTICDLARACTEDYKQAHELARASASAQHPDQRMAKASASDQVFISALTKTRTLVDAVTSAKQRVQDLKRTLTNEMLDDDDDLSATLIRELARSNGSIRTLAQLLANGLGMAQAHLLEHLRAHIYIPDFDQLRTYGENQSFPLDHEHALTCARAFERTPDALWRRIAASDPDRSYLRFWALMNGLLLESGQKKRAVGGLPLWQRDISKQRNTVTICYGVYIDLLLIEERIARNLPAVEGIRLAKEPRAPF